MISKIYGIDGITIKRPEYEEQVELFINGDINDGDYVSSRENISIQTFEELLPIIRKILKRGNYNWQEKESYLTEDEIAFMSEYVSRGGSNDDDEIHSIADIICWYLCSDGIRYEIEIK